MSNDKKKTQPELLIDDLTHDQIEEVATMLDSKGFAIWDSLISGLASEAVKSSVGNVAADTKRLLQAQGEMFAYALLDELEQSAKEAHAELHPQQHPVDE